ncbi:MAG: PQQ-binding-like beta-propeller repeat protein [Planctomycetota bacterium]
MRTASALVLAIFGLQWVHAENLGHWRGDGNGVFPAADPPTEFGPGKNLEWKTPIPGSGSGSPVVWGNQVFVPTAVPLDSILGGYSFRVICLDLESGKEIWSREVTRGRPHEGTHSTNTFASPSPCTDGQRVYASFGSQGLHALSMDGKVLWQRDFGDLTMRAGFGEGSSPVLAGDKLILPWDHEGQSKLYALDTTTGKTIWSVDRDEPSNWGTPRIIEFAGQKQVVQTGENKVRAYRLSDGKALWECAGQTVRPVASPVATKDSVIVMSGFRGSFAGAFRPDGSGDIENTDKVLWTIKRNTPDIGSPVLSGNRLYFYKGKSGLLTCVDAATGEPFFTTERIRGLDSIYASPVVANGRVYLTDRDGTIAVIADAPELKVLAVNQLDEGVDATPAPVGQRLIVRGKSSVYSFTK